MPDLDHDPRPIVLVDMDGTLADVRHRLHHIRQTGRKKDWKRFFAEMDADTPITDVVKWVRGLSPEHRIMIVTGRPEKFRPNTIDWLKRFDITWNDIFMRRNGDHRPDYVVKKEILESLGEARERIVLVIDDRPSVCDMWRTEGLNCHQVAGDESTSPDYTA